MTLLKRKCPFGDEDDLTLRKNDIYFNKMPAGPFKMKDYNKGVAFTSIRELSDDKTDTMGKDSALTMAGPEEDIMASQLPIT